MSFSHWLDRIQARIQNSSRRKATRKRRSQSRQHNAQLPSLTEQLEDRALLTVGVADIAVVGFNSDAPDGFAIVTLRDIPANEVIFFTDQGWSNTTSNFPGSTFDSVVTWTVDADGIPAGTFLSNATLNTQGTVSGTLSFDSGGDQLLIYQTADDMPGTLPPTFIYGFNNNSFGATNGWQTDGNPLGASSDVPTGLTAVTTSGGAGSAFGLLNEAADNYRYDGPTTDADKATWLSRIHTTSNWTQDDTTALDVSATQIGNPNTGGTVVVTDAGGGNTAPTVSVGNLSYTEGDNSGNPVVIDASATTSDSDGDADWDGGSLTVQITANNEAADEISIAAVGSVSLSGANVQHGGTTVGTIVETSGTANDGVVTNGDLLTINFNSNAIVQDVVRAIAYRTTSNDPGTTARTVTFTATDTNSGVGSDTSTVSVTSVNDEPTLTATGQNPTFREGGSVVTLFGSASVSTVESGQTITGLTLTVTNVNDGSDEVLNADGTAIALTNGNSGTTATSNLSYSVAVAGSTATVTFSGGTLSTSATQTLVNALSYQNNSTPPNTANRVVILTSITDSGLNTGANDNVAALSVASTVTVVEAGVIGVALNAGVAGTLVTLDFYLENLGNVTLSSLSLPDDLNSVFGAGNYAIFSSPTFIDDPGTINLNGSFTGSGGSTAIISGGSTLAAGDTAQIRIVVNITNVTDQGSGLGVYNNQVTVSALDTGGGSVNDLSDAGANPDSNGNGNPGDTGEDDPTSIVIGNSAPTVSGAPSSVTVTEDVASNVDLSAVTVADIDGNSLTFRVDASAGTLSASSSGGVTVSGSGGANLTLSGTAANINTYLDTTSNIQYTSALNASGTAAATLTLTPNDGTVDGTSAMVNIDITAVNGAPVLDNAQSPTLTAINEDAGDDDGSGADGDDDAANNANNGGDTVASIVVDASITDVDGSPVEAIAVTIVDNTNGVWQYSLDGGTSWNNFSGTTGSSVDISSAARLLNPTHRIRFVPDANYFGTATFTFRAWDKSAGSAGGTANASSNGGTTAFSTASDTASVTVMPVNDAPVFSGLDGTPTYNSGGSAVTLDSNVMVSDAELDAANDYAGASLTIARNGGANADDTFSFDTSGALFTMFGGNLQSGGQNFATFTNASGTLTISFTSSGTTATGALVDDVLQHIQYENTSGSPPATAQLNWSFSDGTDSDTGSTTVSIMQTPDTSVTLASGTLTITDGDGGTSNDDLTISYSGGTYTITDNGGLILDASTIAGSTGSGTSTITVPDTGVTGSCSTCSAAMTTSR